MRISVNKTIVPYKLTAELQAASVPVERVAIIPGGLEIAIDDDLVLEFAETINTIIEAHDGIDNKAVGKANRRIKVIDSLSPLVGRNITSINNNADRDALIQAICYNLGICDENGLIQAQPAELEAQPIGATSHTNKKIKQEI